MKLKIMLEKGEDGYICASCPSLKGCRSQGKTEAEAMKNIKEAVLLFLEPAPKDIRLSAKHKILELAV